MFDCLTQFADICIPSEYDPYWTASGMAVRVDERMRTDGPVLITVDFNDAVLPRPLEGLTRLELDRFTIFYDFACESPTRCRLKIGSGETDRIKAATRQEASLREFHFASKDEAGMAAALGKLRYCAALDRCAGPSLTLAELRDRVGETPAEAGTALNCSEGPVPFCIPYEYDRYWNFSGFTFRPRTTAVRSNGPVFIDVTATDNLMLEPVDGFARMERSGVTVVYDIRCATETRCQLRIGSALGPERTAEFEAGRAPIVKLEQTGGMVLRRIDVSGLSAEAMNMALARLRYCVTPWEPCARDTSVSFAELLAARNR